MTAVYNIIAGGLGMAALAGAAPAAAQYYPGPGYGYNNQPGGIISQVIDQVLRGNRYGYGTNQHALVNRCAAAVEQRINYQQQRYAGRYGSRYDNRYGPPYGNAYGYNRGAARVVGITDVDTRRTGLRIRGVAASNSYQAGYGAPYGYAQPAADLQFRCNIDYRGRILDIDVDRARYDYNRYPYRR